MRTTTGRSRHRQSLCVYVDVFTIDMHRLRHVTHNHTQSTCAGRTPPNHNITTLKSHHRTAGGSAPSVLAAAFLAASAARPRKAEEACRALWLVTHEQFDFDNGDILLIARTRRKGTAVLVANSMMCVSDAFRR